jgi:hypothetical protein
MRDLGTCRFRGAAGVGAIADNDYYHSECPAEHDKNHNGEDQHLLNAGDWQRLKSIPLSMRVQFSSGPQGWELIRREI